MMHVLSTLVFASAILASSYELPFKLEQIYKEHKICLSTTNVP